MSDQLYTAGFALRGLHEAAAATGDEKLSAAEDKLAAYLCRIQIRSAKFPYLDGGWFRAFDFGRSDYFASSADLGWGAWSVEAGWGNAWTAATLAMPRCLVLRIVPCCLPQPKIHYVIFRQVWEI